MEPLVIILVIIMVVAIIPIMISENRKHKDIEKMRKEWKERETQDNENK